MDPRLTEARDRLARLRREAHEVAEQTAQLTARIEQQTYRAWSRGREVRVTIGPDALIRGVEFTDTAMDLSPQSLAAATLDAHRRALALLRAAVEEAVSSAPESVRGLSDMILASAQHMLPASDELPRDDRR